MTISSPLYTAANCRTAFQLNWSISLFGHEPLPASETWIEPLKAATELDGIRILEHAQPQSKTIQFLVSTLPPMVPSNILWSVKGRLQFLIRGEHPAAFKRNYRLQSVGSAKSEVVDRYLAGQLRRQGMADSRAQLTLERFQIERSGTDLSRIRYSSHGQFIYNLHVVVVHRDRGGDASEESLQTTHDMLLKVIDKKGYQIRRGALLSDHIHLALGCPIDQSPQDIGLAIMNNIAYAHGMVPWCDFCYYVGTFGPYDLGAIRHALLRQSASHRDEPSGSDQTGEAVRGVAD
jgi:REP element-mobilizing transposase RayT